MDKTILNLLIVNEISVIILTLNEEKHLHRCIENVKDIAKDIYVVDSFSSDRTVEISEYLGAKVYQNKWPGNQAKQFNWALENLPIRTEWVFRLDADEFLTNELIDEINKKLNLIPKEISGIVLKRRLIFFGKWLKCGAYPIKLLRLFRYKKAVCEQRLMDEHIVLLEGKTLEFDHDFADYNLNNLDVWIQKHNNYSIREAAELLDIELKITDKDQNNANLSDQAKKKRNTKLKYIKLPLFWRSFVYFFYRYIIKAGFTEGKEGFIWNFFQGWWYRALVDAKIWEIKKECGNDVIKIKQYLKTNYSIEL